MALLKLEKVETGRISQKKTATLADMTMLGTTVSEKMEFGNNYQKCKGVIIWR